MDNDGDELDLGGALESALDDQQGGAPQEQEPRRAKSQDPFPRAEDMPQQREYTRDDAGKFAKKQQEDQAEAEQAAAAVQKAWSPLWLKKEHGVEWDKMPEAFRKALEQREREAAQGIEKHSTAAKSWEPVAKLIEPVAQQLAAAGVSPQQYVSNLVQADSYLRSSPVQAMEWLCNNYLQCGIQDLADWMTQQGHQAQRPDPRDQQIRALEQRINQFETNGQQQQRAALERQISDWSKDKPYFAEVRQHMAALAKANPEATLDQLYDQATWAHPDIRERILTDQRKAEVKRARENTFGTRGAPQPNGQARHSPKISLEEEIGSLLDGAI